MVHGAQGEQPVQPHSPLEQSIVFAIQKFLAHTKVIEAEEKMLHQQVEELSTNLKKRKIKQFIDSTV